MIFIKKRGNKWIFYFTVNIFRRKEESYFIPSYIKYIATISNYLFGWLELNVNIIIIKLSRFDSI
jgi:hypothetical protein